MKQAGLASGTQELKNQAVVLGKKCAAYLCLAPSVQKDTVRARVGAAVKAAASIIHAWAGCCSI